MARRIGVLAGAPCPVPALPRDAADRTRAAAQAISGDLHVNAPARRPHHRVPRVRADPVGGARRSLAFEAIADGVFAISNHGRPSIETLARRCAANAATARATAAPRTTHALPTAHAA